MESHEKAFQCSVLVWKLIVTVSRNAGKPSGCSSVTFNARKEPLTGVALVSLRDLRRNYANLVFWTLTSVRMPDADSGAERRTRLGNKIIGSSMPGLKTLAIEWFHLARDT